MVIKQWDLQLFAEEGGGKGEENTEETKNSNEETTEGNTEETNKGTGEETKTFTQEELDDIVEKRIARERKKFSDYEDIKNQKEQLEATIKEQREAEMTEKEQAEERAKNVEQEKESIEKQLQTLQEQAQNERIKNEFIKTAMQYEVKYVDDAFKLTDFSEVTVNEDGSVEGVDKAVKNLTKEKPFLIEKKEPQPIGEGNTGKEEDKAGKAKLEELAEKARKTGKMEDKMAYVNLKRELGL